MRTALLLGLCAVAVGAPFYNRVEPALGGIPFFYWFQLALVPVSSLVLWLVYRAGK